MSEIVMTPSNDDAKQPFHPNKSGIDADVKVWPGTTLAHLPKVTQDNALKWVLKIIRKKQVPLLTVDFPRFVYRLANEIENTLIAQLGLAKEVGKEHAINMIYDPELDGQVIDISISCCFLLIGVRYTFVAEARETVRHLVIQKGKFTQAVRKAAEGVDVDEIKISEVPIAPPEE